MIFVENGHMGHDMYFCVKRIIFLEINPSFCDFFYLFLPWISFIKNFCEKKKHFAK